MSWENPKRRESHRKRNRNKISGARKAHRQLREVKKLQGKPPKQTVTYTPRK